MTKENKFKIGLCLQGIALSLDDATLERNRDRLKQIEDILIAEEEQEPKTGEWIADVDGYTCSECGVFNANDDKFCPNCGVDMRGEGEE